MGVKRSNPNAFKQMGVRVDSLDTFQTKLGWFENAVEEDGQKSAFVASVQEYGTDKIPPRLGLRNTIKAKSIAWKEFAKKGAKNVLDGKWNGKQLAEALGFFAHKDIYKQINSNPPPPLSQVTLAMRKLREDGKKPGIGDYWEIIRKLKAGEYVPLSSNTQTLVDTGRMLGSLEVKVENK